MGVLDAVRQEIDGFGDDVACSGLAAAALALAEGLDSPASLTSKSMAAKALADLMSELRALAPAKKETDDLARLRDRREQRRSGVAAAQDSARP